jgi:hypothetical protein
MEFGIRPLWNPADVIGLAVFTPPQAMNEKEQVWKSCIAP